METLRTPEHAFDEVPGFDWPHQRVPVPDDDGNELEVAVVRAGPADAPVVVCLHGEPSWSFLYRHVIDALVAAGLQVVAPDLVGFGRSDKPRERTDHTYERHVGWLRGALFDQLDLRDVTLLGQDWGGLLGLRLVAEHPDRFARVVAANTFLPTGDSPPGDAFLAWQQFSQDVPELPVGRIVDGGSVTDLSPEVIAAYDAPFPDESYKEGPRQMPMLVPTSPDDPAAAANRAAWEVLRRFDRPFVCAFSDGDPITAGADRILQHEIPGAAGQPHVTLTGGGHFLQEDCGADLAGVVAALVHHERA